MSVPGNSWAMSIQYLRWLWWIHAAFIEMHHFEEQRTDAGLKLVRSIQTDRPSFKDARARFSTLRLSPSSS